MNEKEWVKSIIANIEKLLRKSDDKIRVIDGHRLTYANEVLIYGKDYKPDKQKSIGFQTDILVYEQLDNETMKPRVVIEAKLRLTTHGAITYSQKAQMHKNVHPYLRYGILLGNREQYNFLPGRLFRHGQHFDFMLSWKKYFPNKNENIELIKIIKHEIKASRNLEKIIYDNRLKKRERFTTLHKPLRLM